MQQAEDGGDAVVIAHSPQLGEQGASVGGSASAVANGGEEAAFGFLLSEDNILIAFFEIVAAVAIVTAGEDVDIRGVGAGESLVDVEMVADDRSVAVGLGGNRGRSGFGVCSGGIGSGVGVSGRRRGRRSGRDGGNIGDGAEKNDIVGLEAGTFSRRFFGTGAGQQSRGDEEGESEDEESALKHRTYRTWWSEGKSREEEKNLGGDARGATSCIRGREGVGAGRVAFWYNARATTSATAAFRMATKEF